MKWIIYLLLTLLYNDLFSQQKYVVGSIVKDFSIEKVLNYSTTTASFSELQKEITSQLIYTDINFIEIKRKYI